MTSLSVLCAVLVTNLHNRGSKLKAAPRWLARLFIDLLARPMHVSQDVQLLASTIYLPEYSQFFFLHDSRWTPKLEQSRTDSDAQLAKDSSCFKKYFSFQRRLNRGEDVEDEDKNKQRIQEQKSSTKRQSSAHPQGSNQSHHACTWVESRDGATQGVQKVDYIKAQKLEKLKSDIQDNFASKRNGKILSQPSHLEMLHLQNADSRPSMACDKHALSEDQDSTFNSTNNPCKLVTNNILNKKHGLQESSLCERELSASAASKVSTSEQGVTEIVRHDDFSLHPKTFTKPKMASNNQLLPIKKDTRGSACYILPASNQRYQNMSQGGSSSTETPMVIPSLRVDCPCDDGDDNDDDDEGDVWVLRDDFKSPESDFVTKNENLEQNTPIQSSSTGQAYKPSVLKVVDQNRPHLNRSQVTNLQDGGKPQMVLKRARIMIAEWCIIAKVMDRILFLLCLVATLFAYVFILIVVPTEFGSKTSNVTFVNTDNTGRYRWSDF
ncbi:nicotinic acetylcholine receptor subunit type q [Plakobranchus ocellatus]|uniref:Nicotinic acetylcholine receptor subunit type q n=1 Tax=Plakobranchus ocellatus TaxID=259542 RepID=A0AAV3ZVA8_9GAST|nr:nicotinic acetylcholine receptor subunit type q [Plakobranchus ocellatus]